MIKQFFYGRVPARKSIFNKSDGYDAFSQSEGIPSAVFDEILKLSKVQMTKEELLALSNGKCMTLYSSRPSSDVNFRLDSQYYFSPTDYTGERPGYYVQTLIFPAADIRRIMAGSKTTCFQSCFFCEPGRFPLHLDEQPAICADMDYTAAQVGGKDNWSEFLSRAALEKLVYALVAGIGSGKEIYVTVPDDSEEMQKCDSTDDDAPKSECTPDGEAEINFYNSLVSVLPAFVKKNLSFVTGVFEKHSFKNCLIKFVPKKFKIDRENRKAVYFDFNTGRCVGIENDEVKAFCVNIPFICDLYDDTVLAADFYDFCGNITENNPVFSNYSVSLLSDIVFLFMFCRDRASRLRDDDFLRLFACYTKYKAWLGSDDCKRVISSLKWYTSASHPLPEKLLKQIVQLYSDEPDECKKLIHGFMLRFYSIGQLPKPVIAFLKDNYANLSDEEKTQFIKICGGSFFEGVTRSTVVKIFASVYADEPFAVRCLISDSVLKMLADDGNDVFSLFIRTVAPTLTPDDLVYLLTKAKNRPAVSSSDSGKNVASLLSELYRAMPEDTKAYLREKLYSALDKESASGCVDLFGIIKKSDSDLFLSLSGECVRRWTGRRCWPRVMALYFGADILPAADVVRSISPLMKSFSDDMCKCFVTCVTNALKKSMKSSDPDAIVAADAEMNSVISSACPGKSDVLMTQIRQKAIVPLFLNSLSACFASDIGYDMSGVVRDYIADNNISASKAFDAVDDADEIMRPFKDGKIIDGWLAIRDWDAAEGVKTKAVSRAGEIIMSSDSLAYSNSERTLISEIIVSSVTGTVNYELICEHVFGKDMPSPDSIKSVINVFILFTTASPGYLVMPNLPMYISAMDKKKYAAEYEEIVDYYKGKYPDLDAVLSKLKEKKGFFSKLFS